MGRMRMVKLLVLLNLIAFSAWSIEASAEEKQVKLHSEQKISIKNKELPADMNRFPGGNYSFTYPDAVRGIYVTGNSAGGSKYQELVQLIEKTELNAMVIDIKDDLGDLTYLPDESKPYAGAGKNLIKDPEKLLKDMEKREIYPIARVVVFKDSYLAGMVIQGRE